MVSSSVAVALRKAVESGNFEAASELASQYREELRRALREAPSDTERAAIAREAMSFLSDRLHLARVLRAHLAAKLGVVSRARSYSAEQPRENTFRFEA